MRRGLLLALLAASACACARPRVSQGSRVTFRYRLTVDGKPYSGTEKAETASAVIGGGDLVPGLERGMLGMAPGESRRVEVPPKEGFGFPRRENIRIFPMSRFRGLNAPVRPGATIEGVSAGRAVSGRVVSVSGGRAAVDFNPPLAGKTLVYDVTVVSVSRR